MRYGSIAVAGMAAVTLAACGQSTKQSAAATGEVSLKNASIAEVGEQVTAANQAGAMFQPGHWQGVIKIADMVMPGMEKLPPEMRAQMQAKMNQGNAFDSCLTPEDVADSKKIFSKNQKADCTYDHVTMADGSIDASMQCGSGSALQKMTMTGTYSRTDYHLVSQASGSGTGPAGGLSMKMDITAHRTGDCKPGEK